ncbi:MAG: aldo/keto reductase [Clostridiales bacterium]|nr:aldo/keto reductase [Clostridiales bacterium]
MIYKNIGGIDTSRLVLGSMRIADKPLANNERLIRLALDMGINTFDHADIYGGGACEEIYGKIISSNPELRGQMVLQTKCGIRSGRYDLSRDHIIESVNGSLKRLNTDYIDILLLHRPDTLMRPEEIAKAFDELEKSGKVRVFGVSNFSAAQIDFLQSCLNQKLQINQVQMSAAYCPIIDSGIFVNTGEKCNNTDGLLEYCRKNDITLQTYGTMQCTFTDETGYYYSGAFLTEHAKKKYFALNFMLEGLAQKYDTTPESVAIAWILHHPAGMQAVIGTTLDKHLILYKGCGDVALTDYEWYKIYESAGHRIP